MMSGRTILCFASGYDAPPTSKHHVMHLLAERNAVLWVNYHASRTPSASASDAGRLCGKLVEVARGLRRARENLHVLTPLAVPLPGRAWARALNRRLLTAQIRAALRRVGRGRLQIWTFAPDVACLLDAFAPEKVLYYCVDDFSEFTGYDAAQVLADEEDLARRADLVVTTSEVLRRAKTPWNPRTILVPHGVDYPHFARARNEALPLPADLAPIRSPRLGFFGLIRDWVDLDLLADVARARGHWHIVMIGDATVDLRAVRGVPNLHFLGPRPYASLPAYCRGFDVGLIPFVVNDLTRAVNPIKLREYLAAGLPVVSTPMPEVRRYEGEIAIADSCQGFVAAIEAALAEDPGAKRRRGEAMAEEAWPRKVEGICRELTASAPADDGGAPR